MSGSKALYLDTAQGHGGASASSSTPNPATPDTPSQMEKGAENKEDSEHSIQGEGKDIIWVAFEENGANQYELDDGGITS
jgi:hypothetical protein